MNKLVSSITAPADRIAAATVPGGSCPGSSGTGIRDTTGTPPRSATAASNASTTDGSVPASVRNRTCSPARTARHRSSTFANPAGVSTLRSCSFRGQRAGGEQRVDLRRLVDVLDRQVFVGQYTGGPPGPKITVGTFSPK